MADTGVSCFVVTNATPPPAVLTEPADAAGVAVLSSSLRTADFIHRATSWLEERLAPETQVHGDLVELHGLGVLLLGIIQNILTLSNVPSFWINAVYGGIILGALLVGWLSTNVGARRRTALPVLA